MFYISDKNTKKQNVQKTETIYNDLSAYFPRRAQKTIRRWIDIINPGVKDLPWHWGFILPIATLLLLLPLRNIFKKADSSGRITPAVEPKKRLGLEGIGYVVGIKVQVSMMGGRWYTFPQLKGKI